MLNKLLKYDLKYMLINMCAFYILSLFFAITTRIFACLTQSVVIIVIGKISIGCMIAMMFNIVINTMIRSWVRFKDCIYNEEAYLTHTLPVTKTQIYESKFFQTLLLTVIGFAVCVISLLIAFYSKDNWRVVKSLTDSIASGIQIKTLPFVLSVTAVLFLEIINGIQSGFLGIIVGHRQNNGKIGFSVLFGFIFYLVSQGLVMTAAAFWGIFNGDIAALFSSGTIDNIAIIKEIILFFGFVYIAVILLMNFFCVKLLRKGVNVD